MDKIGEYGKALGKSLTDSLAHWPAFFGMAGIDWLRQSAYAMVPTGTPLTPFAQAGTRGFFDVVKFAYYDDIKLIKA